jgi:uncharacterized phage protein (TIGR01671 family)
MGKDIKFRAWDKDSSNMLPWSHMTTGFLQGFLGKKYNVDIMQFIGLKDRNGKEIYEGDIVIMHYFSEGLGSNLGVFEKENSVTGDIQYRKDFATYVVNTKNIDYVISEYCQDPSEELEVIGNIYEG